MAAYFEWRTAFDFLASLGEANRSRVLEGAQRITRPVGAVAEYPSDQLSADVVERGLVRAYQVSLDGREATIGYAHPAEYIGALPALAPRPVVYLQAVEQTTLLRLNPELLRELYPTNIEVAHAIAVHTASTLARVVRVVTVRTLGTVRERLAFDLLERASSD